MAWKKTTAVRRETEWVHVDDSLAGQARSMLIFARDGLIAGLVLGVLVGLLTPWPEAAWLAHKSGWSQRQKDVSDQIGVGPARPQTMAAVRPKPAGAAPAPQVTTRNDGTDMESVNNYMPKWDVGFSAAQHTLTFRLVCMPVRTRCADSEQQPAYVTFEGPASSKLTSTVTMRPVADGTSYTSSMYVTGPDQTPTADRVVLPTGVWRMTVTFPKYAKQSEKKFWVSCPRGEACSAVDYAIPILER